MRTIISGELPKDFNKHILIKSNERNRHRSMAAALERTFSRCNEIHTEYESHSVQLRENDKKEGFAAGFKLFFSQLQSMIEDYERLQDARIHSLRESLHNTLKLSLQDTVIVERIIHHLEIKCGNRKPLKIIIPKSVYLNKDTATSHYLFCDENHITVQNDVDAIRFPSDALCHQWLSDAEADIVSLNDRIGDLIPDFLGEIVNQLTELSEKNSRIKNHLQEER